jgi:predicted metal-dependent hydrolase
MEFHSIPYRISYRNVKHPRLEFKTGELLFVLPFGHKPRILLEKHRGWILKKIEFIKECLNDSLDKELEERTDREFKDLIYSLIENNSKKLDVELNNVFFKKMKTKWASCSSRRNLTVNTLMRCLPEHLLEYVVFHEIAHMIEKRHNDKFWRIVSKEFDNYQEMERDLFIYWFRVVNTI